MNKIQDWLKESLGEAKIKRYELIYRATEHGDSNNVLFQKCKNQANLLWIMKNKNNNNIFGCFNSIPISSKKLFIFFIVLSNLLYRPSNIVIFFLRLLIFSSFISFNRHISQFECWPLPSPSILVIHAAQHNLL